MSVDTLVSIVGSLGFPIACCCALFWQQNKSMSDFSVKMEASIKSLQSAVEANTSATTVLVTTVQTLLKVGEDDGK